MWKLLSVCQFACMLAVEQWLILAAWDRMVPVCIKLPISLKVLLDESHISLCLEPEKELGFFFSVKLS